MKPIIYKYQAQLEVQTDNAVRTKSQYNFDNKDCLLKRDAA
jgi:hypothetical protein